MRTQMKKVLPLMNYTRRWRWGKNCLKYMNGKIVPYHALINWVKCLYHIF